MEKWKALFEIIAVHMKYWKICQAVLAVTRITDTGVQKITYVWWNLQYQHTCYYTNLCELIKSYVFCEGFRSKKRAKIFLENGLKIYEALM